MSNKKNQKSQNPNVQHESQEELDQYFSNPTSGHYTNNKRHKNATDNNKM